VRRRLALRSAAAAGVVALSVGACTSTPSDIPPCVLDLCADADAGPFGDANALEDTDALGNVDAVGNVDAGMPDAALE